MKRAAALVTALILLLSACAVPVANLRQGDKGNLVREAQQRLSDWGYYDGAVDGVFGAGTLKAVKWFQEKHGIRADGIIGKQTAEKLGIQLTSSGLDAGEDEGTNEAERDDCGDVYLLARVIYGEARGESYKGKVAVGAVVLNRVKNSSFPNNIPDVVYQKGAFSVVSDGQIELSPDSSALEAARDAMNGVDPTGGAVYYYNPAKTTNQWMLSLPVCATIGNHKFSKGK